MNISAPKTILPTEISSFNSDYHGSLWSELKQLSQANLTNASKWLPRRVGEETEVYVSRLSKLTYNPVYIEMLCALKKGINKGTVSVEGMDIAPVYLVELAGELAVLLANYGSCWLSYDSEGVPYPLEPSYICDWSFKNGSLQWVKSHSFRLSHDNPYKVSETLEHYQVWTNSETVLYRYDNSSMDFKIVSKTPIDAIPFVRVTVPDEQWLGRVCYTKLRQLIGVESSLTEASSNLYIQRTVENSKQLPDDDLGDSYLNARPDALYTSNAYVYSGKFSFAEASGTSIQRNLELVKVIELQIKSLLGLNNEVSGNSNASGESKRYDYKDHSEVLASFGGHIVQALSQILTVSQKQSVTVDGLREFELDNLRSMLEIEPMVASASQNVTSASIAAWYLKLSSAIAPGAV